MIDVVSPSVRSRMMASIRGKDTRPELRVRQYLHRVGFRYRIHVRSLPGRPDIVLKKYRTVILIHGCFWHRHSGCKYCTTPATNSEKWALKFERNVSRDAENILKLVEMQWKVIVIWECGLRKAQDDDALSWLPESIRCSNSSFIEWPIDLPRR